MEQYVGISDILKLVNKLRNIMTGISFTPGDLPITDIVKGNDISFTFTLALNGVPIDLSTSTAKLEARSKATSDSTILSLSTAAGDITMNASGEVVVVIDNATTGAIVENAGIYDFIVTDSGLKTTYIGGAMTFLEGVSS